MSDPLPMLFMLPYVNHSWYTEPSYAIGAVNLLLRYTTPYSSFRIEGTSINLTRGLIIKHIIDIQA